MYDNDNSKFENEDMAKQYLASLEQEVERPTVAHRGGSGLNPLQKSLGESLMNGFPFEESQEMAERYAILMGRSTWPGKLYSPGQSVREDIDLFLKRIRGRDGRYFATLSSGHITWVWGPPKSGDFVYLIPGFMFQTVLGKSPVGLRYLVYCDLLKQGSASDGKRGREEHLGYMDRADLEWEEITIV